MGVGTYAGPGSGWNDRSATAGDNEGGKSGVEAAASVVPSGAGVGEYAGTGEADRDGDGDDFQMDAGGSAEGHADVVPAGGPWPGLTK